MAKYFECDALIAQMRAFKCGEEEYDEGIETAINVCAIADAADVRPVVHGKWIKLDMHKSMEQYKCSVCKSECYVPECMGEPMYGYCPCCGADMSGNDGRRIMNDLISRKYLLECAEEGWVMFDTERDKNLYIHLVRDIAPLKEGKWLPDNRPNGGFWVCSNCKFPSEAFAADRLYKFCPNCGADMRGGDAE